MLHSLPRFCIACATPLDSFGACGPQLLPCADTACQVAFERRADGHIAIKLPVVLHKVVLVPEQLVIDIVGC